MPAPKRNVRAHNPPIERAAISITRTSSSMRSSA
jgi:hypothetical protein